MPVETSVITSYSIHYTKLYDYAVSHDTDFHQFMLYTPIPGTPLYEKHLKDGTLLAENTFSLADAHGQYRFNYRHPHITRGREEQYIVDAFKRDFEVNGPSLARLIRTFLKGWQRYKDHVITSYSIHYTKLYECNLESLYTYEGTHDIHTLILGEDITKISAFF